MSVIVLFEVTFMPGRREAYLEHAKSLIPELQKVKGFLSAERFTSLTNPDKVLSKSAWKDESVITYLDFPTTLHSSLRICIYFLDFSKNLLHFRVFSLIIECNGCTQ